MAIEILLGRKIQPPQIALNSTGVLLIELDLAVSEEHHYKNEISRFPVEDGLPITDHVLTEPEQLTLEGFVTNSPIRYLANLRDNPITSGSGANRVITAYELMLSIAGYKLVQSQPMRTGSVTRSGHTTVVNKPLMVDLYTTLRVFTDMVLESLTIPRGADTGDSLRFRAEFVKIRKVTTESTTIRYTNEKKYGSGGANDQTPPVADNGKKTATETATDKRTILKHMVDGGKSGLNGFFNTISQQISGAVYPTPSITP